METVTDFMSRDHERLDALLAAVKAETDPAEAALLFGRLKEGLDRHIRWEEDLLFPVFERAFQSGRRGPTYALDAEHHEMQALLRAASGALSRGEGGLGESLGRLSALLRSHEEREDESLYKAVDETAGEAERKAILGVLRGWESRQPASSPSP